MINYVSTVVCLIQTLAKAQILLSLVYDQSQTP